MYPADTGDPKASELYGGCGCNAGGPLPALWLVVLLPVLAMRQCGCVDYQVAEDRPKLPPVMRLTPPEVDFGAAEIGVALSAT